MGMENIEQFADRVTRGIAARIREVRESQGMSQQAVADALTARGYEFSRLMVTKTESAGRPITVADLAGFAVVFGVPVTDFFNTPTDTLRATVDNHLLDLQATAVALEELQATITARTAQLNARRAALGG
ncbi:hypothetical protein GCM10025789_02540 [Tessaracoccus lubricantis]|uniref:HTH cro/C1-type domain-containing protein n=2 Tax=Tessaracoccus lubricantis TaxID=545543 RepID=A0ABP9EXS8_9ACTN